MQERSATRLTPTIERRLDKTPLSNPDHAHREDRRHDLVMSPHDRDHGHHDWGRRGRDLGRRGCDPGRRDCDPGRSDLDRIGNASDPDRHLHDPGRSRHDRGHRPRDLSGELLDRHRDRLERGHGPWGDLERLAAPHPEVWIQPLGRAVAPLGPLASLPAHKLRCLGSPTTLQKIEPSPTCRPAVLCGPKGPQARSHPCG